MSEIKTYKITLKQESKIISIPTSMQLFGYVFSKIIREGELSNDEIVNYLSKIQDSSFNISSLMPKGYVPNPTLNYFIENFDEDYTTKKSNLSKKIKKYNYIKKEYLNNNLYENNNNVYLKVKDFINEANIDEIKISETFKKYSSTIVQHVQINSSEDKKPNPFNNSVLNIKNEEFEFYIQIDSQFSEMIDNIFNNLSKDELIILGGQSSKGFNMFSFVTKEEIKLDSTEYQLNLGYYFPQNMEEISKDFNNELKVKTIALRPVKKISGAKDDTRYRTFYIPEGSILKLNESINYGSLIDYKEYTNIEDNYKPKIYLKSFMFNLNIQKGGN